MRCAARPSASCSAPESQLCPACWGCDTDWLRRAAGTGQRLLRLEPFKAGNGPGLYVYLSGHPTPRSSAELHADGAVELAPLKGNVGNQNYLLPPDLDLAVFKSVVIYCKPFSVVFSTAALA